MFREALQHGHRAAIVGAGQDHDHAVGRHPHHRVRQAQVRRERARDLGEPARRLARAPGGDARDRERRPLAPDAREVTGDGIGRTAAGQQEGREAHPVRREPVGEHEQQCSEAEVDEAVSAVVSDASQRDEGDRGDPAGRCGQPRRAARPERALRGHYRPEAEQPWALGRRQGGDHQAPRQPHQEDHASLRRRTSPNLGTRLKQI